MNNSKPQISSLPGVKELLKRTWQIYKERFLVFLGIMLIPFLIAFPLGVIFYLFPKLPILISFSLLVLFTIITIITTLWSSVSLLYAIKERKQKIGIKESLIRGWSKLISYCWVLALTGLIVLGGFLLLIAPGIIFSVWFSFATFVLVSEDLKGMNALFRSKQLVAGFWWKVFWRLLAISIIGFGIGFAVDLIGKTLKIPFIEDFVGLFLTPFLVTYSFLIYEDLRKIQGELPFEPPKRSAKIKFILVGIAGILLFLAFLVLLPALLRIFF